MRPEFAGKFLNSYDQTLAFGYGVEQLRDVTHYIDNVVAFYPTTSVDSKFKSDEELLDMQKHFVDKFDQIVLVNFDMSKSDATKILEITKLAPAIGFVIC